MNFQEGTYTHFDSFKEVIKNWTLDFTMLSKGDFSAYFKMFTSEQVLLSRETLNGTIIHSGVSPIGFRTLVIPVNREVEFVWFNKPVKGDGIFVFPDNNAIDVVTFNGLDIHLISIEEAYLFEVIAQNSFQNCREIFDGKLHEIFLTEEFSSQFFTLANEILNPLASSTEKGETNTERIIHALLTYLENNKRVTLSESSSKKNKALLKATEIIKNEKELLISIPQLCEQVNISERSLYNAFKEKYRVSPGDYLKAVRLNQAREDLYQHPNLSVSEIAGKYDFWHMGQFAKDFKRQFGVLPSEIRINLP